MKAPKTSTSVRKLLPYVVFPMMIGVLSGILIFLFKIASSAVISHSEQIYAFVRQAPIYLPVLLFGAAATGAIAAIILKRAKECRGGGIPTAVASIRGLVPLKWVQGIFVLFGSALITYLTGVPLGNEGPSVQMGAAVGSGCSRISKKNKNAWERYFMTGGACSGFAIATGAPLSGIMFAFEEAHRRFSAPLFAVASISVLFGTITQKYLSFFFGIDTVFFNLTVTQVLPMKYLWATIIKGAACGICSLFFTKLYRIVKNISKASAKRVPFMVKIVFIFTVTAMLGFLSANLIGTGHSLIETLLHGKTIWYLVIIAFVIRALVMIFANNEGVTGGIFVPNLAFGAMIASLIADGLISLGLIESQYYTILIVVGMASFLAASSRTPITAVIFAAEALCLASNIIPVICGVVISYVIVEASGKISFTDTVIESRAEATHHGKPAFIIETSMTVQKNSFVDGMDIGDILWPPTCAVLAIDRKNKKTTGHAAHKLFEGDVLHLYCQTYDPDATEEMLASLLGAQPDGHQTNIHRCADDQIVPSE